MRFKVTGQIAGLEGPIATIIEADTRGEALKKAAGEGYATDASVESLDPPARPAKSDQVRQGITLDPATLAELDRLAEARLRKVFRPVLRVAWLLWWVILAVLVLFVAVYLVAPVAEAIMDANSPYNDP